MASSPMVNLRASGALSSQLASRGDSMNAVALRDLRRYYAHLETALREIHLSRNEWDYLRDILSGAALDEHLAYGLPLRIIEAEPGYGKKWDVDPDDLAGRLRTMPAFSRLAIVDAIDRRQRTAPAMAGGLSVPPLEG